MNFLEPHLVRFIMVNMTKLIFSNYVIAKVDNLDTSHMVRRYRDTAAEGAMQYKEHKRLRIKGRTHALLSHTYWLQSVLCPNGAVWFRKLASQFSRIVFHMLSNGNDSTILIEFKKQRSLCMWTIDHIHNDHILTTANRGVFNENKLLLRLSVMY